MNDRPIKALDIASDVPLFDRFASHISHFTSKAAFFIFSVVIVVLWVFSYFIIDNIDTWQLIINTGTTILTFWLVSLLQNTQTRDTNAIHTKLNSIADGLADLMETIQHVLPEDQLDEACDLERDIAELRAAVGIEHRESS